MPDPAPVQRISGDQLLKLLARVNLQRTDRWLRQLADKNYFPQPRNGEYEFLATLLGILRYYLDDLEKQSGSLQGQRLRKLTEEADKLALDNEKTRGGLVETEAVYKHLEGVFVALRARILASNLDDLDKDQILNDLRQLKARDIPVATGSRDDPQPAILDPDSAPAA